MPTYAIPTEFVETELEVKKSRFIARVHHIESREQALALVANANADHPDARHVCWAYLLGNPQSASNAAANDDGEPSGTAGKPILNVIQHKGIGDVLVIVIRYFGGIKLGAGGLVRAYGGAAEQSLSQTPLLRMTPKQNVELSLDFAQEQSVRHWLDQHAGQLLACDYSHAVNMTLSIDVSDVADLHAFCAAHGIELKTHA